MPVNTRHPEYVKVQEKWQRCRDTFDGADAVKAAGTRYLPMLTGFKDQTKADLAYEAYKYRAPYFNHVQPTVVSLTGAAFLKPIERARIIATIEEHLKDVTLQGQTIEQVAKDAVGQVLSPGRYGILVDMPGLEVSAEKRRPYWVLYRAEQIVNWRTIALNGEQVTVMVVLEESNQEPNVEDPFVLDQIITYRVLSLRPRRRNDGSSGYQYQVNIWRQNPEKKDEWIEGPATYPMRRQEPLEFIPFVVIGPEGTTWGISDPPILPIVDATLSLYLTNADKEWGEHMTALPTPVITGASSDAPVHLGSSEAMVFTEPQAKAFFMEFSGAGLESLRESAKEKVELIAHLGARMLERQGTPGTATEVKLRHAGEYATLSSIVGSVSQGLSKAVQWHSWWMGSERDIDKEMGLTLSTDFIAIDMSPEELNAVMKAHQAGEISFETFFYRLQKGGFYATGTTLEDERSRLEKEAEDALAKQAEALGGDVDIEDDETLPQEERDRRAGLRATRDAALPPEE